MHFFCPILKPSISFFHSNTSFPQVTYQFFHWKKGTPFAEDQGIYNALTWWEQMDNGKQLTTNRKFLTVVPVVLWVKPIARLIPILQPWNLYDFIFGKKKNQVFDWIAHNQLRTTYALVQHPCSRNSCDCKVSLYAQSSYLWYQCWELNRSRNNLCTTRLISSTNTLATCSSSLSRWQWQKLWQRSMELDSRNFKILPSPCYSKFQIGWFNFVIVLKNVYIEPLAL